MHQLRSAGLFIFFILFSVLSSLLPTKPALAAEDPRFVPVQHNGRVKPYDSFARQTLKLVSGKETWQRKPPTGFFLEILEKRGQIADLKWIRVDYGELKNHLGLTPGEHFYSLNDIFPALDKIQSLVQDAKSKRDKDMRPSKLEQKAEQLYTKIRVVQDLISGESPSFAAGQNQESAIHPDRIQLEVFYNQLKPFEWAAILYFLAFLAFLLANKTKKAQALGLWVSVLAFCFHTFGLGARIFILARPPVSNMYESMIFMNWALLIFAFIFWGIQRVPSVIQAGCAMSGFIMLYANLLPIDSSLDVVVAVLRSNYWLTVHVLTIVSSYGAFGLALGLGHRHLFLEVTGRFTKKKEEESADLLFSMIQLGTLLVGTGTFLGGVWANESWGRFWGWDPKETWALITFLGYLLVVHLKYAKKLTNFSLALFSIFGFMLVLMTWYGVNFVLGRGLHSYGAGSGGMHWVIYFLIFELLFVGWVVARKRH